MVITFASHAKGPGFETRRNLLGLGFCQCGLGGIIISTSSSRSLHTLKYYQSYQGVDLCSGWNLKVLCIWKENTYNVLKQGPKRPHIFNFSGHGSLTTFLPVTMSEVG